MKKILLLLLFFIPVLVCGQNTGNEISGIVFDSKTKKPVPYVTVYVNGTTIGCLTNEKGEFLLKSLTFPCQVVASHINYFAKMLVADGKGILRISLDLKPISLDEVTITAKATGSRKQNVARFKTAFFGSDNWGENSKLLNENVLMFSSTQQRFTAEASAPLEVELPLLGYRLKIDLIKFQIDNNEKFNGEQILITAYCYFTPFGARTKKEADNISKNRLRAYYCSHLHFYRSLYNNSLGSNGYLITKNSLANGYQFTGNNLTHAYQIAKVGSGKNLIKGHVQLKKEYFIDKYGSDCLRLTGYKDSSYVICYYYKNGSPVNIEKEIKHNAFIDPFISKLFFLNDTCIIRSNGTIPDNSIMFSGKIGEKRIGSVLPEDYYPELQTLKQKVVDQSGSLPAKIIEEGSVNRSIEDYVQLNQALPGEKIYLHTDRPNYMQGDTIWFKAYSWYGYDQVPDTTSGILYINLLNQNGRAILTRKLLIEDGTSRGDFSIDSTITPGSYTLRAYTRWMQNMNTGEPFYQTVTISPSRQNFQVEFLPVIKKQPGNDSLKVSFRFFEIDPSGNLAGSFNHKVNYSMKIGSQLLGNGQVQAANTEEQFFRWSLAGIRENDSAGVFGISIKDDRLSFEKQFQIPIQEGIDVQFFPEGGRMINGLEGRVAFKAIGRDGLSREVEGVIETGEDEIVTPFKSAHKGMGSFLLTPQAKKLYFAHILYNNRNYIIPVPKAVDEGSTMSVSFTGINNEPFLLIKQSPSGGNTQKYVVGSAYGKIWFSARVKMAKDSCRLKIPVELLPEGVCRLTVLNNDFKPECERLIYVDKRERFKIKVIPDSSSYGERSKVTLSVETTDGNGEPVQADLSLAVVDKEQVTRDGEMSGICDYKLLESELKGYIEDAGYYFKDDSCTNYGALDLLMLTQGYRKFLQSGTITDKQKFQPEKGFNVSGKIKLIGSKSREKKFNYREVGLTLYRGVNLTQKGELEGYYLDQNSPDSFGQFRFKIPPLYGKSPALLQAKTSKGKPLNADILLNDTVIPPLKFFMPQQVSHNTLLPTIENVRRQQAFRKTEISINQANLGNVINLPEVTVKARPKNYYNSYEDKAVKIADLDSLDPTGKRFGNVYDLLVKEFNAKWYNGEIKTILLPGSIGIKPLNFAPIYVINSQKFSDNLDLLNDLPINEIKKIMVFPFGGIIARYYESSDMIKYQVHPSCIIIETYNKNFYRGDPEGTKTFILDGLDAPRAFYSPRYEGPSKKSPIYDGRPTLFWEPSLRTDGDGEAKVEFYTRDRKTDLEIIVSGIEVGTGHPGQKQTLIK